MDRVVLPLALAGALLSPLAALAVETAPAQPPASTEVLPATLQEIAAATALANSEIEKVGGADIFENVTDSALAAVRHRPSGLVCRAGDRPTLELHFYDGSPRGDDVSCGFYIKRVRGTLYATRYTDGATAEDALQGSIAAIHQNFQDVEPYTGSSTGLEEGLVAKPLTVRLQATFKGNKVFTRTSTVQMGEWVLAQRITAPIEDAAFAEVMAEMNLFSTIMGMSPGDGP